MPADASLLELIDLIYRAAGSPSDWARAVRRLTEALRATAGTIHHHQIPSQASNFSADWNIDPSSIVDYVSYYGLRNIWRSYRPGTLPQGSINISQTMCPDDVFRRSEYYNDFLRRYNHYHCLVGTLREDQTASSYLVFFRPKRAQNFGEKEQGVLAALMPHLMRAAALHDRIQGLEKKAGVLEETLNRQPTAIVFLDAQGHVLFMNMAAASLFQTEKALRLTASGIAAAFPAENKPLNRLVSGAINAGVNHLSDSGGTMLISRGLPGRPLQVLVSPLRSEALFLGNGTPAAAIFITDPERKPLLPAQWLRQLYGLTQAEARLAQLLLEGFDLKESAEQLHVLVSTVRSQLKSIFAKTETNRQSELLRLLLLGPSQLLAENASEMSQRKKLPPTSR